MTKSFPLNVRLIQEPVPTATSIVWKLWWRLAIGDGVEGAGPAGAACLQLRDQEVTVWADYAEPDRLLQIDVPFGRATGPGDDTSVLAQGELDERDAKAVEQLLGAGARDTLVNTMEAEFTLLVHPLPTWGAAGRAALIETMLAERNQPAVGLWAIELEVCLYELGLSESTGAHTKQLAALGAEVSRAIPSSLADPSTSASRRLANLLQTFDSRHGPIDGPVMSELRSESLKDLGDEVDDIIDAASAEPPVFFGVAPGAGSDLAQDETALAPEITPPAFSSREPAPRAQAPAFLGRAAAAPKPTVLVDYTAAGLVRGTSCEISGLEAVVHLTLAHPVVTASRRLDVRGTTSQGLVAAVLSCDQVGTHDLEGRFPIPAGTTGDDLTVVVGRGLPVEPVDQYAFEERQAIGLTRRLVNRLSKGIAGAPENDITGQRLVARNAWSDAGRPDLALAVDRLEAVTPLITPQATPEVRDALASASDLLESAELESGTAAATRDLLWSLGDVAAAARVETKRRTSADSHPLPPEQHEPLVLALLSSGDQRGAEALDELRPRVI